MEMTTPYAGDKSGTRSGRTSPAGASSRRVRMRGGAVFSVILRTPHRVYLRISSLVKSSTATP